MTDYDNLIEAAKAAEQTDPVVTRLEFDTQGVTIRQRLGQWSLCHVVPWREVSDTLVYHIEQGRRSLVTKKLRVTSIDDYPVVPESGVISHLCEMHRRQMMRQVRKCVFCANPGTWRIVARRARGEVRFPGDDDPVIAEFRGVPIVESETVPDGVILLTDLGGASVIAGVRMI